MKAWFARFNTREQLSLLLLALAVGLYLMYAVAWLPLAERRAQTELRNAAAATSLQRVDAMVSELTQLRESGAGSTGTRNLTSLVNQTTSEVGLSVSRLQPGSRGDMQVRLESADFAAVVNWLYLLEQREALVLQEVSITQSGTAGRVNATVRIGQGA